MKFDSNKVAFGRHETFALRYSWLTKGLHALNDNSEIFTSDNATVVLGVGKNMVNAIRYWLMASQLIKPLKTKGHQVTDLGGLLLNKDGYDPYLEDEATIWLIHWLIASNAKLATSCFWFFNNFHKPEFEVQQAMTALLDFTKNEITAKTSLTTIQNDLSVILRMYAGTKMSSRITLEDLLDSPLSSLNLIQRSSNSFSSVVDDQETLPIYILGFAVHQLMTYMKVTEISLDKLLFSNNGFASPGAIFRLSENALITKLEQLVFKLPHIFGLNETAGIHQLYYLEKVESAEFLKLYYESNIVEVAA